MAHGDKTKAIAFDMWTAGKSLSHIQASIEKMSTTKPGSVKGWIRDWERGKQRIWSPKIN